jgi:hypothetical protein
MVLDSGSKARPPEGPWITEGGPAIEVQRQQEEQQEPAQPAQPVPPSAIPDHPVEALECGEPARGDDYYTCEDLKAQRQMAASTDEMAGYSLAQSVTAAIGAMLLIATLVYTAKAAFAAADAAKATRDSVDLAAETAQRQLRAYVTIIDVKILFFGLEYKPNIRIVYKNSGMTPAYKVKNLARYPIGEPGKINFSLGGRSHQRRFDLGPGQEMATTALIDLARWNPARHEIATGKQAAFAFGEIEYLDAFGAPHYTRYRYRTRFDDDGIKDSALIPCDEGNESN